MKSTGIVRKVDELGRVVLPIELRKTLGIDVKNPLEIFINGDQIILQKYQPNVEKEAVKEGLEKLLDRANSAYEVKMLQRAIALIK